MDAAVGRADAFVGGASAGDAEALAAADFLEGETALPEMSAPASTGDYIIAKVARAFVFVLRGPEEEQLRKAHAGGAPGHLRRERPAAEVLPYRCGGLAPRHRRRRR
jgi:hypothetical protein